MDDILKVATHPKRSYLCDSHAESVGEEQASVPFKQRATPQEWQSDEEERRAALLNMQGEREKRRGQTDTHIVIQWSLCSSDSVFRSVI
ncbi:hypothetical protein PAMP_000270 [Pampus punctatissimus]